MAGLRTNRSSGITLFALFVSLVILGGVLIGERLTDTAQAATGDLGAWTATTPLAAATWAFAAAASPSYLYVSGGEISGGTNLTGTMRAAIGPDGGLGAWQDQTLLSTARIDHGMVYTETAAGNRCLYVVGGYTSQSETVTNSVEYATVGSGGAVGNWTQTSAMNAPRAHFGLASYNGRLYAVGGNTTLVEFAPINSDCSLGGWQNTTVLTATRFGNRSFAALGYLYTTGDVLSSTLAPGVQRAPINSDGTLGAWAGTNSMSQGRGDHAVIASTRAGYVYVLGGVTPGSARTASVERAVLNQDGTLGPWTAITSLPSPSEDMAYAQAGGRVYMLGGSSGSITNTVLFGAIEGAGLPDLSASAKRVSSAGAIPGQVLTYTIVLTNTGSGSASAMVTDTLPVSVAYVPGSTTGSAGYVSATRAVTWSGAVAGGSAVTITYSGVISTRLDNGTAITNTASINDGNGTVVETGPVTTTITSSPVLSGSAKLVDRAVATPGQTVTYTVVLTNTGNMNASARVTDTLPVSVTYVLGSAGSGATYDTASRSVRWNGAVTAGMPVSITYQAVITSPLDNGLLITNTATIYDGINGLLETVPVTTTISSSPDLSTSRKTVNKAVSSPGGTIGYSIVVSNTGTMNISVRVTDTLPISLTYIASSLQGTMGTSAYDSNAGSILWAGPALVGVPVTISYQARVPASTASGTLVTNTATIQGSGATPRETSPVTVTVVSNPSRIGWTNLGLYGAIVSDIAVDSVNGIVYQSGTANPGVYRTANGGESWMPTTLPSNCGPVVVEKSRGTTYANCQQNLWKTTDAGVSWTNVLTRSMSQSGFQGVGWGGAIAVTATTVYVGDSQGSVWRSDDAGATWNKRGVISQGTNIVKLALDPSNALVVYGITANNVYKTTDGGASWTDISPPGGDTDFRSIGVSPINANVVFVGTVNTGHLWKSTDGGASWAGPQAHRGGWLRFHPTDPNTIYAEGVSHDGGATWEVLPVPGGGLDIDARNPNVIYANSGHGVQKSVDGGATWREINTGLEEVPIDDVAQNPQDPGNYFVASRTGFGSSHDNGVNWNWPLVTRPVIDEAGFAVDVDPSSVYIAGNGLGKSTDSGRTWTASDLRTKQEADLGGGRSAQVHDIGMVPGDPRHVFAALAEPPPPGVTPKGGVYESTDGGLTWEGTGVRDLPVNSIGFGVTASGTIIYAGVGDQWGTAGIAAGVYTSTVGNTSVWSRTSLTNTYIWKLRMDPTNPLVVYAGGIKLAGAQGPYVTSLYKSTNGGATWADLLPAAPRENSVTALAIDPLFPNNVYYAAGNKIYQSVDGGGTWSIFADVDLGGEGINALLVPLAAPSPVVSFTAAMSGSQAALSWTNPSDSDFTGVLVKYSTQGFPMLSTEGITLTTAAGLPGATGVYTHTEVISGTTYYYSAFAYNQAGRYSLAFQVAANSSAAGLSAGASDLLGRSLASVPRRPATQANTRTLFAAAGAGLFAKEIGGQTAIYLPALMKQLAPGW